MAPKNVDADAIVNTGPTQGVNTGDRNEDSRTHAAGTDAGNGAGNGARSNGNNAQVNLSNRDQAGHSRSTKNGNGSKNGNNNQNGNGNGNESGTGNGSAKRSSTDSVATQLNTAVGSLQLPKPSTAADDSADSKPDAGKSADEFEERWQHLH